MPEINIVDQFNAQESWKRARRKVFIQKVLCTLENCSVDLIPFEEVRKRLYLTQKMARGLKVIELAHIRGSVGRYRDFTSAFLPRGSHLRQRWQRVKAVFSKQGTPPIEVYQVGDAYFVIDGNHRVSIARQEGLKTIEAYVTEYLTPYGLSAKADLDEVILKAEHAEFLNQTHLDKLRPDLEISFTSPGNYQKLLCLIEMFRDKLEKSRGAEVSFTDALLQWFDMIYAPIVNEIKQSETLERFPHRTPADLFIWMWKHHQKLEKAFPGDIKVNSRFLSWKFRSGNR